VHHWLFEGTCLGIILCNAFVLALDRFPQVLLIE
jgi:hypothetical protein